MTDRELLELAAKAAGYADTKWQDMRGWGEIRYGLSEALYIQERDSYWNPLVRDGDALRLAAKLQIDLDWQETSGFPEPTVEAYRKKWDHGYFCASEDKEHYRRAIVRVAAEIAKEKGL